MNDKPKEPVDLKAVVDNDASKQQAKDDEAQGVAADALNLIDEHEEEVHVDGKTVRHRGVYLLPNLFTTAALFSGFYAVVSAMNGSFEAAAIAIFVSMVLDGLDGRVARMTNTQSKFGAEYDSLADMVSFGVAPAFVMFSWALSDLGKFGWATAFIYVACAALRLARFNTQIDTQDKNFFSGLASPSAAAVVAGLVWVCFEEGYVGASLPVELAVFAGCLTAAMGFLMVSNVPYNSFKGLDLKGRVPFVMVVVVILLFGLITIDPARVLFLGFLAYTLSGPICSLISKLRPAK